MKPADFLRALMRRNGDNSHSLARKLGEQNMQPLIHRFVSGKTLEPRRSAMQRIADHYEVDIDAFYDESKAITEWAQLSQVEAPMPKSSPSKVSMEPRHVQLFPTQSEEEEIYWSDEANSAALNALLNESDVSHGTKAAPAQRQTDAYSRHLPYSQKMGMLDYVIQNMLKDAAKGKYWFAQDRHMTADWVAIPHIVGGPPKFEVECKIVRSRSGRISMLALDRQIGTLWRYKQTRRTSLTMPIMIILVCDMDAEDYKNAEIDIETMMVMDAAVKDELIHSYCIMAATFTKFAASLTPMGKYTIEQMLQTIE